MQVYEQEVTETKKRKQTELSEIDGRLQVEYEAKLQDALRELREQYEEQLKNNRTEVEFLYETKVMYYMKCVRYGLEMFKVRDISKIIEPDNDNRCSLKAYKMKTHILSSLAMIN